MISLPADESMASSRIIFKLDIILLRIILDNPERPWPEHGIRVGTECANFQMKLGVDVPSRRG